MILRDAALTAIAPIVWGSTYVVTTLWLPPDRPLTMALMRALPAGLLLLAATRRLPFGHWWGRVAVLGALNFAIFWACLFVSAYRLPGGVAATVGAIQPLLVIGLQRVVTGAPVRPRNVVVGIVGMGGVALLVMTPAARLDPIGIVAALGGAASMALGTVLTRHWHPPVPPLTFTAWQLVAGGILILPIALLTEPPLPALGLANVLAIAYLGLIGAALTYFFWFRGIGRLEPTLVAPLGFLSPMTAVILGFVVLGQSLSIPQMAGMVLVLGSVWANFGGRPRQRS